MRRLLLIIFLTILPLSASANCRVVDVTTWQPSERTFLRRAIEASIGVEVFATWVIVDERMRLCASVNLDGVDLAAMQIAAQSLFTADAADRAAKVTETNDITTELNNSLFCLTATFADIETRLDAQKDAIQTAINAIDATDTIGDVKTAMTTDNTRDTTIFKAIVRCFTGYMRLHARQHTP